MNIKSRYLKKTIVKNRLKSREFADSKHILQKSVEARKKKKRKPCFFV